VSGASAGFPARDGSLRDLLFTYPLAVDRRVNSSLGCSDHDCLHEMTMFKILRDARQASSRIKTLEFQTLACSGNW